MARRSDPCQTPDIAGSGDNAALPRTDTVAERLWAKFRKAPNPKPAAKELKEALAMVRQVREPAMVNRLPGPPLKTGALRCLALHWVGLLTAAHGALGLQTNSHFKHGVHTVIDVCGGHGILAMLMLIYRKCQRAVVLDLHRPPSHDALKTLWAEFFPTCVHVPRPPRQAIHAVSPHVDAACIGRAMAVLCCRDAELEFRECDMTEALPGEIALAQAAAGDLGRVAVYALHACDFLSDIAMDAAIAAHADFAIMPCCAKACKRERLARNATPAHGRAGWLTGGLGHCRSGSAGS
jgi:hypothetical protein